MDKRVKNFLRDVESNFIDYHFLVIQLEAYVNRRFCLESSTNPVAKSLPNLKTKDVKWIIQEYSQFSNEAIHMLLDARIRAWKWHGLAKEIDRNIEEEKGSNTEGKPHLELMRTGYNQGLSFEVNSYRPSHVTETFLVRMRKVFRSTVNPYLAGAILALESTSIPEFYVLDALVKRYHADHLWPVNESLQKYVDGHKVFEKGHKEGLINAIAPYIKASQVEDFARGYLEVCLLMSDWWESLSQSVVNQRMMKLILGVLV